ncbi:G-type lectin S-receptor-like serine/threonine-protein kinase At4g27290 [Bidens hawaiensis]|uniref:G-type lectin S-receptor-like serine/threonine-protein kinase At4g27290 n=1 Tax=Bidens hawaiensis TaxID=980011 RepID=UPI00404B4D44
MVTDALMAERKVTMAKLIFAFLVVLCASITHAYAANILSPNQTIRYNETIVSPQETFELGFFSPDNSTKHYVGIWYKKRSYGTVVWVANGDAPLTHTSGTLLPGMKLGRNLVTGIERRFTSWKSDDDPATGNFSYGIDTRGYPQVILMDSLKIKFRAAPWNGNSSLRQNPMYNYTFVINQKKIYFQFDLTNALVLMRVVLHPNGRLERLLWDDNKHKWNVFLAPEIDQCDQYAVCGPNGRCNIDDSPVCECMKGFEPKSLDPGSAADSSQGCQRTIPLDCGPGEGFNKYSNLKLPDTRWSWYNQTMTLVECEKMCKSNCSCSAYTNSNVSGAGTPKNLFEHDRKNRSDDEDLELPLFGLSTLLKSTDNFSMNNKLGEGGYGPVYKGVLEDGKEIVVKRGYMALEYARDGVFSIKSDVYSFGVVVLEIICGVKNRGFVHREHFNNLMGHAWGLYNEGRSLKLVAKCLGESINVSQVQRCIHIGLLCVQRRPEDRPTMTSVILMLGSEGTLPSPKEPGFYVGEGLQDTAQSYGNNSNNELTISMLDGR